MEKAASRPVGMVDTGEAVISLISLRGIFRASVVSPAGARGLMQIMPAAARDHAGALGYTGNASDLNKPDVNLAFGQRHLQMLRDHSGTQALLPEVRTSAII